MNETISEKQRSVLVEQMGLLVREGMMQMSASERQKGREPHTAREAARCFLSVVIVAT